MVGVGRSVRSYVCAGLLSTREGSPSKGGCICTPLPPPPLDLPLCTGGARPLVARARAPACPSVATPLPCTWDAVTTCTLVTVFFPLGVWLCLGKKFSLERREKRLCSTRGCPLERHLTITLIRKILWHNKQGWGGGLPTIRLGILYITNP